MVCLELPLFLGDARHSHLGNGPQGGHGNQQPGACCSTCASTYFPPNMHPLYHICTAVDNTVAQGCSNQGSVSSAKAVGPILRNLALLTHTHQIYSSFRRIKVVDNTMAEAASRLNHLTRRMYLQHPAINFPQKNSWRLLTLLSGCRQSLTYMMYSKFHHMVYQT